MRPHILILEILGTRQRFTGRIQRRRKRRYGFRGFHGENIEEALPVQFGAHPYPFSPGAPCGAPGTRP